MSDPRGQILRMNEVAERRSMRREEALVREISGAYERARKDLLAAFMERMAALGDDPSPEMIRRLANDVSLIRAIENRLAALEREYGQILRRGLGDVSGMAFEQAAREIGVLAEAMGITPFQFAVDPLLELTIGPAMQQIPDIVAATRATLLAEMRERLASGDRMGDIAKALFGKDAGPFPRGRTSAELATRRAVVQANNMAKGLFFEKAQEHIPGLMRQAVATISANTTKTCLRVHGQIRRLDEPFDIVGTPSFGRKQMNPGFHWRCRTSQVAYHPAFEERSSVTTAGMREKARAELEKRES